MNAIEIEEAVSQLAAEPFDPDEFPFAFMQVFDAKDTTIERLRKGETNKSDAGGILWRNDIDLAVAEPGWTVETLTTLHESPQTAKQKAKLSSPPTASRSRRRSWARARSCPAATANSATTLWIGLQ